MDISQLRDALDWIDDPLSSADCHHQVIAAAYREKCEEQKVSSDINISIMKNNKNLLDQCERLQSELSAADREKRIELENARMDYANCMLTLDEVKEEHRALMFAAMVMYNELDLYHPNSRGMELLEEIIK